MYKTASLTPVLVCLVACGGGGNPAVDASTDITADTSIDSAAIDASPDAPIGAPTLSLSLERMGETAPYPIAVTVTIADATGAAVTGATVTVTANGGAASSVTEAGSGRYTATVTVTGASGASGPSGEVEITASATVMGQTLTATRTAISLPHVDSQWGQPEAVPGLVNTPGNEDGPEVSPDGEWLIVSSYSPVDLFCCLTGCRGGTAGDPTAPECHTTVGPFAAPARPEMLGASRISADGTVQNQCPSLCLTGPGGTDVTGFTLFPVAAYGFHRQRDGSFAEPFVIGTDADGCGGPFGYSMIATPGVDGHVGAVFAYRDVTSADNDVYSADLTMGQANILGHYSCQNGAVVRTGFTPSRLALDPITGTQGNPNFRGGYLFFDNDIDATTPYLRVTTPTGTLPGATFSPSADVPVGAMTDDRRQPFFDQGTLYYARNLNLSSSVLTGDPTVGTSWSAPTDLLVKEPDSTRAGAIFAVGEPSIAHRADGSTELYFVYARRGSPGFDFGVGRVRHR